MFKILSKIKGRMPLITYTVQDIKWLLRQHRSIFVCTCFPVTVLSQDSYECGSAEYSTIPALTMLEIYSEYARIPGTFIARDNDEWFANKCIIPYEFIEKLCIPAVENEYVMYSGKQSVAWHTFGPEIKNAKYAYNIWGSNGLEKKIFENITVPLVMIFKYGFPVVSKSFSAGIIETLQNYMDVGGDAASPEEKREICDKVCELVMGIYNTVHEMDGFHEPSVCTIKDMVAEMDEKTRVEQEDRELREKLRKDKISDFLERVSDRKELLDMFNSDTVHK